jgi:hypothetical protein
MILDWLKFLNTYSFTVKYKKGLLHALPDPLSRIMADQDLDSRRNDGGIPNPAHYCSNNHFHHYCSYEPHLPNSSIKVSTKLTPLRKANENVSNQNERKLKQREFEKP